MSELIVLPAGIEPVVAALIVAATLVTSLISALFGVGGGTIALALLAVLLPATALIPIHGVVQLGANAGRTALMLPHVVRPLVLPFVLGSAAGSTLSTVMYVQIPPWLIQYAVAAFVAWSVLGRLPAFGSGHVVAAGAFSGFLTMLFGATGTFVSAFVKSMRFARLDYVATHAALMTFQHAIKVAAFVVLGFSFAPYAALIVLMLAGGFVGTWIGRHILVNVSERRFRPALNVILLLLALRLTWIATESLLAT